MQPGRNERPEMPNAWAAPVLPLIPRTATHEGTQRETWRERTSSSSTATKPPPTTNNTNNVNNSSMKRARPR